MAARGDRAFLHRLQHGRLGFGRGAVDFVGQADLGEDRPPLELELPPSLGRFHDHVGAQDVGGHQVGRELDPRELQVERFGQRADQERLAQPRHALQEAMPAHEEAGQYAVDDLVVSHDDPSDLFADGLVTGEKLLRPAFHGFSYAHAVDLS